MSDPWCGRRVAGRFDVLALLGKGAMGAVYRARDVVAGRDVALKVLLGHRLSDKHRARFQREGEVTAALDHPGIVRIYSAGELPGEVPWITYELIDGARTLAQACDGVDLERRVAWVRDAARALGVAHAQGIVHRDVKPDNLLVDAQGRLKVADFGMAWATGAERLTRTGTLVGTPYFMSPEQVAGDGQEARPPTDVWALGVTLYWALTGAYPFDAPTFDELAFQVLRAEPVAPHAKDPAVPRALSAVCLQCLEKEPGARYPDAEALAADLDRALAGEHVLARRRLSARTQRRLLLSLAPTLALLLLVAAVLHTPATPPTTVVETVRATTSVTTTVSAPSPPPPASTPTEAPPLIELAPPPEPPPGITYTGKGAWDFAHNGLSAAMKALGGFYEDGKEGFPTDAQTAARWYQKGVDLDDSECMCELAKLLLKGKGVPRDAPGAAALLERAVSRENVWAMRELAELFEKGAPGVPVDSGRALALYERHSRMASEPAWTLIRAGVLLRDAPPGVTRDEARAVALFERAAGFGNPVAARDLALMLRDGRGAPKDEARAFALLERAVADGDEGALLRLGEMYAAGRGVAQDEEKARALFEEAERKRVKGSRDALRALNRR